ncbi:MAG: hypothetical protein QGH60_11850 [Phycisphaerae bacterium]|nr:hypothetical protein [Phycisphaerae bacterium]
MWLRDHWQAVTDALTAEEKMAVAGVIGPADVVSLSDGVLCLEYSADYEGLRRRGVKIVDDIDRALTALAGTEITCKLNPAEGVDPQAPPRRAFGGLSTAETSEISRDPAVKILLESFEGTLSDARRDPQSGRIGDDE